MVGSYFWIGVSSATQLSSDPDRYSLGSFYNVLTEALRVNNLSLILRSLRGRKDLAQINATHQEWMIQIK